MAWACSASVATWSIREMTSAVSSASSRARRSSASRSMSAVMSSMTATKWAGVPSGAGAVEPVRFTQTTSPSGRT